MANVQKYTKADVAGRNGKNNAPLWIIVKDEVYNVSAYLQEHPGGEDVIKDLAGKDSTEDFESVGHTTDAWFILKKYKIGEIVEEEKRYDANGKKKKRVVDAQPGGGSRSCMRVVTCGLLG